MFRYVADGLRYCRTVPAIGAVLAITVAENMLAFPYIQLLPVFARDVLRTGPVEYGLLAAGDGIGSLLGSLALLWAGHVRRPGAVFVVGSMLMPLGVLLLGGSKVYWLSLACVAIAGMGNAIFGTFQSSIILGIAGEEVRGRAMGALTLAIGSGPLGSLQMGAVAGLAGAPVAVAISGALGLLCVAASALLVPDLRRYEDRR